jgi:hypothetical protein
LRCSAEPWLVWTGEVPLRLASIPELIGNEIPGAIRLRATMSALTRWRRFGRPYLVRPTRNRSRVRRLASGLLNKFIAVK